MPRNHEQTMGYWLNEPAILNHQLIVNGVKELADSGYGIMRIMLRNSNFSFRSPEVIAAVAAAVKESHKHGLKVVMDSEPHRIIARDLGRYYPQAIASRLFKAEAELVDGHFKLHVPSDDSLAEMLIFESVEAAFVQLPDGVIMLDSLDYQLNWETSTQANEHSSYRQDYVPNGKIKITRHTQLTGILPEYSSGKLTVYVKFRDNELVDFAAKDFTVYYRELLDCYKEIPLDGVCWDEPAIGGDWTNYRYGNGFCEFFEQRNGYPLKNKLYLLDNGKIDQAALQVRQDYHETLNEALFQAQKSFIDYAGKLFGKDLILGTHHTWQGEGGINDYRAGAVDYFRLNDSMDAGYTDCCWWDRKSVAYSYILGSSLGRLTPSGECECNTWHWKPTNSQIDYNSRLMSLMNINWFNIWYGNNADTCMYPDHYTWSRTVKAMQQHKKVQQLLNDTQPVVEVAVLHDWRTVAGINRVDVANLHKAFCLNLAAMAIDQNVAFDFIDERLLAESEVNDQVLNCKLGSYKILVIPFGTVISAYAWKKINSFIKTAGQVVFAGPPPTWNNKGKSLTAEFAALFDMEELPFEKYLSWFSASCTSLPQDRPDRFDPAYPLAGNTERLIISSEDEACGITSKQGNCIYLSGFEPSESVIDQLQKLLPPQVDCYSDSILWRHYRSKDSDIIVLIAKNDKKLSGIVGFKGQNILFEDGSSACLFFAKNKLVKTVGSKIKYQELEISVK